MIWIKKNLKPLKNLLMKKLPLLIAFFFYAFWANANDYAWISRVKFNNINKYSGDVKSDQDFTGDYPMMLYQGYSETFEVEVNWSRSNSFYQPDDVELWIDLNENKQEEASEKSYVALNLNGAAPGKKTISFSYSMPGNVKVNSNKLMKISLYRKSTCTGCNPSYYNTEKYTITFRAVDFPYITKTEYQSKTITDTKPDLQLDHTINSPTDSKYSFNLLKDVTEKPYITVTRPNSNVVPKYLDIHIDQTRNGDFQSSERVVQKTLANWASGVLSRRENMEFKVPNSWWDFIYDSNLPYRMRFQVIDANGKVGASHYYTVYFKRNGLTREVSAESVILEGDYSEGVVLDGESEDKTTLYPNPTNSNLTIDFGNLPVDNLSISSAEGNVVFNSSNVLNKSTIDVSTFAPGMYYLKYSVNDKVKLKKFVVSK